MRTDEEVQRFLEEQIDQLPEVQAAYYASCYEACIPRVFWEASSADVRYNKDIFKSAILPYCSKWRRARKHGYGFIFSGGNGNGKSFFGNFILTQMIKRGCSAYYTTAMQLDIDMKRGFRDSAWEKRLDEMTESDFFFLDELGKERGKTDSYFQARLELLLKTRCDNGDPTIIASNMDDKDLEKTYGGSVQSIFDGKYEFLIFKHGDYRGEIAKRMRKEMGYEDIEDDEEKKSLPRKKKAS